MLAGLILGATLVIAVLLCIQMLQSSNRNNRYFFGFSLIGVSIAGTVAAIVLTTGTRAGNESSPLADRGDALTAMARIAAGLQSREPGVSPTRSVASVPSLIDGLKLRLEADPSDARGWALLAQSYAFVGQAELAEQAVSHAVELGLDEVDLRGRVASAQRSPHSGLAAVTSVQ
jgi:hypothetical protein